MNSSLAQIEAGLFKSLKNASCQTITNICTTEPNITLKDILTNPTYLEEKLNIFIWLMFKFEPKFANDFIDSSFYAAEKKSTKIIEGLYTMGLIDHTDFTMEKLINSKIEYYKITLLIINELNNLLISAQASQYDIDDIFSYDIQQFQPSSSETDYFAEIFSKKILLFEDPMFIKEYRSVVQPNKTLIPSDLNRLIKNINENSKYLNNYSYSKTVKKEDFVQFLTSELDNLEKQISSYDNKLNESSLLVQTEPTKPIANYKNDLIETKKLLKEFNLFVHSVQSNLDATKAENCTLFDEHNVESNLGKNFFELSEVSQKFTQVSKVFWDWSRFITIQSKKQEEYADTSLINYDELESTKMNMEKVENELQEFLCMLGYNGEGSEATFKKEPDADCTAADKLLML